jgi:hypothetical protein
MSGDARDFNNIETRAINTFFNARKENEGNSRHSQRNIRGNASLYGTIKNWVAQFKRGNFFHLCSTSLWRTQNSDQPGDYRSFHELIVEKPRISAKYLVEQLDISRERFRSIIPEDLDIRKLSAKWVQKCLNADENVNGVNRLNKLGFFRRDPNGSF